MHFNSLAFHNMTENDVFNMPINMAGRNPMIMDGIFSNVTSISLAQSNSLDLNQRNQIVAGFPVPSMLQGEPINNLQADLHISNRFGMVDCNALVPINIQLARSTIRDTSLGSSSPVSNTELQVQLMNGTPISAASLATLLATRCGPNENLNSLATSAPSVNPMEDLKIFISNDYSDAFNSSFATSMNYGYDGMLGEMNSKWEFDIGHPEIAEKVTERTGFQPFQLTGSVHPNGWISSDNANVSTNSPSGSSKFSNELSLSLTTCQPSVINGATIPDHSSEINCSAVTRPSLCERQLASEQTSCNIKNISLGFGSYRSVQLSRLLSGSRYLRVIQEILTEIASYSLDHLEKMRYPAYGFGTGANISFSSSCLAGRDHSVMDSDDFPDGDSRFELQMDPVLRGWEIEAKKKQLLALLKVVDDRYNQCLDEVHTVISAFHAATELDPHLHACFALQTLSFLYKNLRERINNQILRMVAEFNRGTREEGSSETPSIPKQWALQQLKRKDHQLWRPQRGLPERSVSVLRAWMFQNFLHPYPKDAEKHLLAVKSGLTRSQVSNWFINARVRLWKPMIEEMYSEMNRRKGHQNDEETDSNRRGHISIDNRIFKII